MDITVPHSVEYEVTGPVTIDEVILTLQANAELIQELAPLLERLVPGLTVERITLQVREIRHGSLREVFFAALVVAFQEDLKKEIPPLVEKLFGTQVSGEYNTLLTISVLALLFYMAFGQAGLLYIVMMAALIFFKHQGNIRRLLAGEESRIGAKS